MYATKGMSATELIGCLIRRIGLLGKYQKGLGHLQYREYDDAYQVWLELAGKGHSQSQFDLGVIFHNGMGFDKDHEKALYWFEKAASHENAEAENYLGTIYESGNGAAQDIEKALMYFKRAMEHGNENARVSYSELLAHGLPIEFAKE